MSELVFLRNKACTFKCSTDDEMKHLKVFVNKKIRMLIKSNLIK